MIVGLGLGWHVVIEGNGTVAPGLDTRFEALMNLRNQVEKRLNEHRAKLEKQLAAITGQLRPKGSIQGCSYHSSLIVMT